MEVLNELITEDYGTWTWSGDLSLTTEMTLADGRKVSFQNLISMTNGDALEIVEVEDVTKFRADQRRNRMGQFAPEGDGGGGDAGITLDDTNSHELMWTGGDSAESLKHQLSYDIAESMVYEGVEDWEFQTCFNEMDAGARNPTFEKWEGQKSGDEIRVVTIDDGGNVYVRPLSNLNQDTLAAQADYTVEQARTALEDDYAKYGDAGTGESHLAFDPNGAEVIRRGVVSDLVGTWATTSNDSDFVSHAVQETVKDTFKLQGTADWKEVQNSGFAKEVANFKAINGNLLQNYVKAQYDATQTLFANKGITQVQLYRGTRGSVGLATGSGEATLRPISSWTTDINITARFAQDSSSQKGTIFRATVNVKDIISTPFTGVGCLGEQEIVVLGGVRKVDHQEAAYVAETGGFD